MGKQEIPVAVVCFVASLAIVIFVLVGSDGSERDRPVWLTNYETHAPLIGIPPAVPSEDVDSVVDLEAQALMESLSPGVRAHYEGAYPTSRAARRRLHDREEAEYAAFIEERMRRLSEVR